MSSLCISAFTFEISASSLSKPHVFLFLSATNRRYGRKDNHQSNSSAKVEALNEDAVQHV